MSKVGLNVGDTSESSGHSVSLLKETAQFRSTKVTKVNNCLQITSSQDQRSKNRYWQWIQRRQKHCTCEDSIIWLPHPVASK